jgi:hypothetical protein
MPCLFYSGRKAIPGAVGDEVGSAGDAGYGGERDNVASVQAEHQVQSTSDNKHDQENTGYQRMGLLMPAMEERETMWPLSKLNTRSSQPQIIKMISKI